MACVSEIAGTFVVVCKANRERNSFEMRREEKSRVRMRRLSFCFIHRPITILIYYTYYYHVDATQ